MPKTKTAPTDSMQKMAEIANVIATLKTLDDLKTVSAMLKSQWSHIKTKDTRRAVASGATAVGSRVLVKMKGGIRLPGTVVKVNRVTVQVTTDNGRSYNVSPSYLIPETTVKAEKVAKAKPAKVGNIYDLSNIERLIEKYGRKKAIAKHGLRVVKRFETVGLKSAMKLAAKLDAGE